MSAAPGKRPGGVNRLTWLGHSTVAIDLDGTRVLTDPLLRDRIFHLRRHAPVDSGALEAIQAILVSHVHYDHLDLPSLARLGRSTPVLVPRGAGFLLRLRGFADVRELEAGDEVEVGPVRVLATHAEHGAVLRPGTWATRSLGYVLRGSRSVYFAGDTDLFEGMAALGPLGVALLPVAGWGPRLPPGHLDPERAARALTLLRPRLAVPIHWGTYRPRRAGLPDDAPARAFAAAAAQAAPDVAVLILRPGESCPLP